MKRLVYLALAASIILNLISVYRVFDNGITMTYQEASSKYMADQLSDMAKLTLDLLKGQKREAVALRATSIGLKVYMLDDESPVPDESKMSVGNMLFIFKAGRLASITFP